LVIPATALLSTGKRDIVWVETKPNTFEPREVVKGLTDGSMVQILRGLEEGATVAISGGFLIDSESQLQQPVRPDTELQTHTAPAAERKPAGRHVHD
jgi:Cu(I)/Ag(I) efflux system membrane fusion protein